MPNLHGYISYIINPKSGSSSHKLLVSGIKRYFEQQGIDLRIRFTRSLLHAGELAAAEAVNYDCGLVVTAGGDGTVREVAHGLEGCDKPLLVVPCGTENLLANELGFDSKLETLISAFESFNTRSLDLGSINGKCFTSVCGFGFDGDVVNRLLKTRTGHINHFDYFWPLWRSFWEYGFPKLKVAIDGQPCFEGRGMVFVGNISHYAIGLQVCRHADYGDGKLDLCIYECREQAHLLKHAAFTVAKIHTRSSDVIYKQCKEITVEALDFPVYTQIDGDPGPPPPAKITVLERAIRVLTPPGAKPAGIRTRLRRMIG